jgi:regulatory protein
MGYRKVRKARPPLAQKQLHDLALKYVGRYATTRARLRAYLARKIREQGWDGEREPDLEALANRLAELGYVDDEGYALSQSRALTGRGYGSRRVAEKLRIAGIEAGDGRAAREHADQEAVASAVRFAERRKIGPFALAPVSDPREREKALGAMVRAGHSFALARAIVALAPGAPIDFDELEERFRTAAN